MKASKKKKRRSILFTAAVVLVAALLTLIPFLLDARQQSSKSEASILSAQAERGDIRKTLSGTGTITEQQAEEVSVPEGVKVREYLVTNGQFVREGDPVAVVDKVSVMETISALREVMDAVATEMEQLRSGSDYSYVSAVTAGKVKAIYAGVGEAVQDVILRDGALAVLSLDGMMAVRFPAGAGTALGQSVTVTLSDGTETAGRIETVIDGVATATISDTYGRIGEAAEVFRSDGRLLGSGTLYVHSAWKALATEGTVTGIYVQEDQTVSAYGTLMVLSGASAGGEYEALAAEHRDYEEIMADLFRMYQDGVLKAPCDGCVSGVDDDILKQLSADGADTPVLTLLANAPEGDPDGSFINVIGIVTDAAGTAYLQNWQTEVEDYADTAFLVTAVESFTKKVDLRFSAAYQRSTSEKTRYERMDLKDYVTDGQQLKEDGGPYYICTDSADLESADGKKYEEIDVKNIEIEREENGGFLAKINGEETALYTKADPVRVGEWNEVGITVGGIYLFAFDRSDRLVFMVWLGTGSDLPKTSESSSGDKNNDRNSDRSENMPAGGGSAGTGAGGSSGGTGSGSGTGSADAGTAAAKTETRYPVDGTTILSVTPQETVTVSITVDELDILYVRKGQEALVTLDALQGRAFSGVITEVNTTASNEGGNSKYSAVVELARDGTMLGGMNASANIIIEERDRVLLLPSAALTEQNGASVVYTAYDSREEALTGPVTVETGLSDGDQVQILSGLDEGDTVWYSYYDKLEIEGLPDGFPPR